MSVSRTTARRPWPMKWVVVAILVVIVPYTYLTLRYRKPGPAFEPYSDLKDRANTIRLLSSGFQRINLIAQRPAEPIKGITPAPVAAAAGGLPDSLRSSLIDQPRLPAEILTVSAAPSVGSAQEYSIQFSCALPDDRQQLGGALLYLRNGEIFLVPNFEPITGDLRTRSRKNLVLLTVPAGALKPGSYHATILGQRTSKAWTLQVH
jgi:hypothetical protein